MPIYDYECTCCPYQFELKRSFAEDSPVSCPQCGGKARRVFSPVPVIFKGSGFYATDSRGNHSHPPDEGGADHAKAETAKTETGSTTADTD